MEFKCLINLHIKKAIAVFHFTDTSFNWNIPSCKITYTCMKCRKVWTKTLAPFNSEITIEEINQEYKR